MLNFWYWKNSFQNRFNLTYMYIDDVFVHKQPRIQKLSGTDVSCWTWDQRYHREHHFCFLPRFTYCRSEGMANSTLPSTTNEMISISVHIEHEIFILKTKTIFSLLEFHFHKIFHSCIVIFNLRRTVAFLSLNLYDTPGLPPRMNVLFWGPGDIPGNYLNSYTSWNTLNRHSGSFMVDTGNLFSNMNSKSPAHEC